MNKFVFIALFIVSILFRIYVSQLHLTDTNYAIQQDNYADYASALRYNKLNLDEFSQADLRLLPGYPVLIALVSFVISSEVLAGLIISLVSYVVAVWLFYAVTNNRWVSCLFMFFPPVWIEQTTKVSTEPLVVALLLGSLFLFLRKKFFYSGLILGFAFDVRLIAVCLLVAYLIQKFPLHKKREVLLGFLTTSVFLFIFNIVHFGSNNIFIQFMLYPEVGRGSIGVIQIVNDIFRTIDWRQYRILLSGLFYILFNSIGLILLYKTKHRSLLLSISFYWLLMSLLFIGVFGPTPLLEEFARFSVPFLPAILFVLSTFQSVKKAT